MTARIRHPAAELPRTLAAALLALALLGAGTTARSQEPAAEPQPEQEPAPSATEPKLHAAVAAGAGVGLREITLPTASGQRRIRSGPFPALDVALHAEHEVSGPFWLGARVRYQTSIGLVGRETPYAGVLRETAMRMHHVEAGLEPTLKLARSAEGVSLGVLAGWAIRALRTESGLSAPDYSLHGPLVRLEARIPLAGAALELRLAPELIVWLSQSGALHRAGALEATGLALGAEAGLRVGLARGFALDLGYRGSRGSIASALGGSFLDIEHFLTLQLALVY